jgi:hypothetical protein
MQRSLFTLALVAGFVTAMPAWAQSSEDSAAGLPSTFVRSERLDIYGAGMCHQCEWRPHLKAMPAEEHCGVAADGTPNRGTFECGRNPQCDNVCNFVSCIAP